MGKRHPNFPAWQWRTHPQNHQHPTNRVLQLIATPLFIIGFLLMVSGVFSLSLDSCAVGLVGVLAALALQRHGHNLETGTPSADSSDDAQRLVIKPF